ncbi:MAG: YcjX family protein [Kangiellaceae bacterium]|nr:YcjX family protein [Kangiellaceae bacterium]
MSEKDWFKESYYTAKQLVERGLDKHVRIAVTGLSCSGKTAFITSFINQLLFAADNDRLPFFDMSKQQRIVGAKIQAYPDLHIPEFRYSAAIEYLTASEPQWPPSTSSIAQSQIKIRYKVSNRWYKKAKEFSSLTVDIVDYPGEWLLDLPLLRMSFKQWSTQCTECLGRGSRKELAQDWLDSQNKTQLSEMYDEQSVSEIAQSYRAFLQRCKQSKANISLIQPGRFILPGELAGAPVLDFFPVVDESILAQDWSSFEAESTVRVLEKRFNYYRDKVVKPFFYEYFSKVDRQILLVDCLSVLNSGYESYRDMQFTLSQLLQSFNYGQSNWVKRLFNPSIDKLMIAATKSDHVPPEQHRNLEAFMQNMLQQARNDIRYEGIKMESMAISSINVTQPVMAEHDGKKLMCVQGVEQSTKETIINFPGKIPQQPPTKQQWSDLEFDFVNFAPSNLSPGALPHIRMDKVLHFLLGDKFL